jgi:hypothetical protein
MHYEDVERRPDLRSIVTCNVQDYNPTSARKYERLMTTSRKLPNAWYRKVEFNSDWFFEERGTLRSCIIPRIPRRRSEARLGHPTPPNFRKLFVTRGQEGKQKRHSGRQNLGRIIVM